MQAHFCGTLGVSEGCGGAFPSASGCGSSTSSPGCGCGGAAGDLQFAVGFRCPVQASAVANALKRAINSPGSFVPLSAVGATGDVTHGELLYLTSNAPITLRLTTDDGLGGSVVVTEEVNSIILRDYPSAKFLKLLEVKGIATIAYLVTGPS